MRQKPRQRYFLPTGAGLIRLLQLQVETPSHKDQKKQTKNNCLFLIIVFSL